MLRRFLIRWLFGTTALQDDVEPARRNPFSTHAFEGARMPSAVETHNALVERLKKAMPTPVDGGGWAMDDASGNLATLKAISDAAIGDALYAWYASQGFIGHQLAAVLAQNWLIGKVCAMPARDAIRNGFEVKFQGVSTPDQTEAIKKANKKFRINKHMQEFVRQGRVFGIRIAIFKIQGFTSRDYERPFNIDSVRPGSYSGIVQVDPYWCSPQLDLASVADPASSEFYDPTWWLINGVKYHKSHLAIFRTQQPADILKPSYLYGGIPVPQQIMERVYAAERCANEAPQLAMTKRLTVWNTDLEALYANQDSFAQHMANFMNLRDNYGVKINDTDDKMEQFDTTLTDVDVLTMTQYQLVAAAGGVPATKILGTSPKGFNSTGDYDEASYHEHLEDIQENDLTPMLEHHLKLVVKSELTADPVALDPYVEWSPTDSPTGKEIADRNLAMAQADQIYTAAGAIDGQDVRDRLRTTRDSGYFGIQDAAEADDPVKALEDATTALEALVPEKDPLDEATLALVHHPLERATAALHNA